jgi:hypothetical protein
LADISVIPAIQKTASERPARPGSRPSIAVVCDFLEEGWPSMDLFGDMLAHCYQTEHADVVDAEQLRPALHSRFTVLPFSRQSGFLRNADRLINRYHDYPLWLKKRAHRFDLFHIVDHSYGQLALDLPPTTWIPSVVCSNPRRSRGRAGFSPWCGEPWPAFGERPT